MEFVTCCSSCSHVRSGWLLNYLAYLYFTNFPCHFITAKVSRYVLVKGFPTLGMGLRPSILLQGGVWILRVPHIPHICEKRMDRLWKIAWRKMLGRSLSDILRPQYLRSQPKTPKVQTWNPGWLRLNFDGVMKHPEITPQPRATDSESPYHSCEAYLAKQIDHWK